MVTRAGIVLLRSHTTLCLRTLRVVYGLHMQRMFQHEARRTLNVLAAEFPSMRSMSGVRPTGPQGPSLVRPGMVHAYRQAMRIAKRATQFFHITLKF